ncbi:succinylglutamate desuccinylase [Halobacteriovorax sp. GB3]|uniref:succinylglutamate desuccinylase n=1 Tax=Halobacteriovorax sp. GB3 TaxID=2719615 RepID=UPI0023609E35|nr:succinylglutamate desuccinylase [Halobacteriovorax sp. GB3]MDD0852798.1 succinylglutamate desuccinylase [Halobacteriovorax sp. GB3]
MNIIEQLKEGASFLNITRQNEQFLSPEKSDDQLHHFEIIDTGIILVAPKVMTKEEAIILSCAIHGNETAPIEILDEILIDVFAGKITLKSPFLFIFGNPKAMNTATRFIDYNLNRLFVGAHKKKEPCYETQRAARLEEAVDYFYKSFDFNSKLHYDLHTAIKPSAYEKFAIYPYLKDREHSKEQLFFLSELGLDAILFSKSASTTFSHHTTQRYKAHAFTVELGKVHSFGNNPMEKFTKAKETLRALAAGEFQFSGPPLPKDLALFDIEMKIIKHDDSFSFIFPKETPNFTSFKKGQPLYREGEQEFLCPKEGLCIVFPNEDVNNGQRAGLLVKKR